MRASRSLFMNGRSSLDWAQHAEGFCGAAVAPAVPKDLHGLPRSYQAETGRRHVPEPLIEEVESRIRESIRKFGSSWVIAVSGGSDSVGLLRLLHAVAPTADLVISVAHLDHGERGEAGLADAAFVADLAEQLGLPFDLGHWKPERSGHFESDARRARYAWLSEVARTRGASVVAVGHTRDDQAETILHRIVRGTGIRGLAGIPEARRLATDPEVTLVRPLLGAGRVGLQAYLAAIGQSFRDDATNADITRTRARLRHDLIPRIEAEYNPRFVEALTRLGKLASASSDLIEERLRELESSAIVEMTPNRVVLDRRALAPLDRYLAIELIRRVWARVGWPEREMSTARWDRLHEFTGRPVRRSRLTIGSGIDASLDRDRLILCRRNSDFA